MHQTNDYTMKGVLLVNLGSPEAPTPEAVKPYLDEFLMDKRVIDLPYLLRAFVVRGIILRKRPVRSAAAYKKIWWNEGSPLIVISKRTQKKIQQRVEIPVALAMRYGNPSIESGLKELAEKGVTEVLLLSMYPQYAMATIETIEVLAEKLIQEKFPHIQLTKFPAFYNRPDYIQSLVDVTKRDLENFDYDHILFSYHGVPERHIKKTDKTGKHKSVKLQEGRYCCQPGTPEAEFCYRTHCFETTRQVVEKLAIPEDKYTLTFQSRLGIDKWLQPFTSDKVVELAQQGVKKLAVITPAFVADCIETLEEIEMEAGKDFKENGGEAFKMITCLNDDNQWMDVMASWIKNWISKS